MNNQYKITKSEILKRTKKSVLIQNLEFTVKREWGIEGKIIAFLMCQLGVKEITIDKKFQRLPVGLMIADFDEKTGLVKISTNGKWLENTPIKTT